jgi:hypothetical protein
MRGLAAGLFVAVLVAAASRIWPLLTLPWLLALAWLWGGVGLGSALLLVWLWPRSALEQARLFDLRLGLHERFSTAVEVREGAILAPDWLAQVQLADALEAGLAADPAAAFPLRLLRRDWLPAALALALLAAALWLPNPMFGILAEQAAVRQAVEAQIEELEVVREDIAADPQLSEEDRAELLELLDGTVEELEAGDLSREEALAELTQAGERLRQLMSSEAEARAAGLQRAAQGLKEGAVTHALGEALLNEDYQAAAAVLENLSNDLGEALTREQELELADGLAEAAGELAESNPELAALLDQAADSIRSADIASAREALAQASQTTGQTGQQIAASRAAQRAAQQAAQSGREVAQAGGT